MSAVDKFDSSWFLIVIISNSSKWHYVSDAPWDRFVLLILLVLTMFFLNFTQDGGLLHVKHGKTPSCVFMLHKAFLTEYKP